MTTVSLGTISVTDIPNHGTDIDTKNAITAAGILSAYYLLWYEGAE